jgi:hypothetical protein
MFSTAMILFIRPQPIEPVTSSAEPGRQQSPLNTRFLRYALVIFIVMFSMSLVQPLSQNFLQNERGVSLMQIGRLISVRSIGIVLLNLTLGPINARIGFLISQATMGLSALLLWQGTGMLGYALGYLLMGSQQTARALASAQGRVLVQAANMGIAYGTLETVSALAYILAPPLAGYLYTREPELIYSASLVFLAVAILVTLLLSPVKVKDLAPKGSEV